MRLCLEDREKCPTCSETSLRVGGPMWAGLYRREMIREFKQTLRQRVPTIEIFIQNKRNE